MTSRPAKPAPATPAAAAPAQPDDDKVAAPVAKVQLKKREFIDRASERSGVKKADAKAAVEATLSLMAEALAAGQEIVLPPLGRMKVTRVKEAKKGQVLMLRLQSDIGEKGGKDPLAEAAE